MLTSAVTPNKGTPRTPNAGAGWGYRVRCRGRGFLLRPASRVARWQRGPHSPLGASPQAVLPALPPAGTTHVAL